MTLAREYCVSGGTRTDFGMSFRVWNLHRWRSPETIITHGHELKVYTVTLPCPILWTMVSIALTNCLFVYTLRFWVIILNVTFWTSFQSICTSFAWYFKCFIFLINNLLNSYYSCRINNEKKAIRFWITTTSWFPYIAVAEGAFLSLFGTVFPTHINWAIWIK